MSTGPQGQASLGVPPTAGLSLIVGEMAARIRDACDTRSGRAGLIDHEVVAHSDSGTPIDRSIKRALATCVGGAARDPAQRIMSGAQARLLRSRSTSAAVTARSRRAGIGR